MGQPKGHLRHLDGLRACLALYVVAHHCYLTIYPAGAVLSLRNPSQIFWYGRFAVGWFIALSGYCLMIPVVKDGSTEYRLPRGALDFFRRRARRILPTFYAALVLSLVLCWTVVGKMTGTHWDASLPVTRVAIVSNLLMLQDMIQPYRINHSFWSIAVEWRIYFLFPVMLWLWRRMGAVPATVLISSACFVLMIATHFAPSFDLLIRTYTCTFLFTLGVFSAAQAARVAKAPPSEWIRLLLLAVAVVLLALAFAIDSKRAPSILQREIIEDATFAISACLFLFLWTTPGRSVIRPILASRPFAFVGVFAYSIYLTHAPLVQLIWQLFIRNSSLHGFTALVVLQLIALPASTAAAFVFFLAFEKPFLSRKQRAAVVESTLPEPAVQTV